jgi:hypothetical protein
MPFLNPVRRPVIQHPEGHPVDVIVSVSIDARFRIDYIRLEDDRGERFTYKISYCHLRKAFNFIETYDCEYVANGRINYITLVFDVMEHYWVLG